ncbi:MAG: alternative ribosome rescue factor ArfA [Gammaproteobacteria bacterium]
MKKKRTNHAKRLVNKPAFRARIEKPAKGSGSYRRKPKHITTGDQE